MTEKKLIPIEIMDGCNHCEKALNGLNNLSDSLNVSDMHIYLRREFGETKWHISALTVDGVDVIVEVKQR